MALTVLLSGCDSNGDEPEVSDSSPISCKSFTRYFEDDSPYDRSYDLAFIDDNYFEFSATAHGTTGNMLGCILDTYTVDNGEITFEFGARGFIVGSAYVKPVSAHIDYENEDLKIAGLTVKLRFESFKGKVTYSNLKFEPSDYKPISKIEKPNLKESDFSGTIWMVGTIPYVFHEDHTLSWGVGASWSFDKKAQSITVNTDKKVVYHVIRGDSKSFETKEGLSWMKCSFAEAYHGWADKFVAGEWINENGETLIFGNTYLGGSLAPEMPNNTKKNIYETQEIRFSGSETGSYYIRYEGKTWDISKYIPWSWDMQAKGGSYEIKDLYKSYKSQKLILKGFLGGTYTRK